MHYNSQVCCGANPIYLNLSWLVQRPIMLIAKSYNSTFTFVKTNFPINCSFVNGIDVVLKSHSIFFCVNSLMQSCIISIEAYTAV